MAVIFMTGYKISTKETMIVPVFRLKKADETDTKKSLFVDLIGRVYQDWTDLLQNNVFLQWWICLPTFGMYTYDGEVQLIFQDQTEWGKVLENIDKVSTISRFVSLGYCNNYLKWSFQNAILESALFLYIGYGSKFACRLRCLNLFCSLI